MATAGYSGTPLVKKLGIKPGRRLAIVGAPRGFDEMLGELPADVTVIRRLRAPCDVLVYFTKSRAELHKQFLRLMRNLPPAGGLWIAWPKKASGVHTDVTEDVIREAGLANGLVDYKVCAINHIWSGLKFARRKK